ncbi:unnamed protein product [Spirodela intermedia]|uniref:H15 domain-containing protein n=1 Tax=Spirodela intermedia TaxID=51605 RepID=A0A7I8JXV4_SPIIN|nr:unnamed protein product [Spirodela intermedia]
MKSKAVSFAEEKVKKARAAPAHPPYLEMAREAIHALKERTGSSQYAISKFIEEKHRGNLPSNFRKLLLVQLRRFTAAGKLTKVKYSYKLPPSSAAAAGDAAASKLKVKASAAAAKPKVKVSATTAKPKVKVSASAAKPKVKVSASAAKPKGKASAAAAKLKVKASAATSKLKVKASVAAAKPKVGRPPGVKVKAAAAPASRSKGRPAKVARTSGKDSPGKKVPATSARRASLASKNVASGKSPAKKAIPAKRTRAGKA